jgi:subtilisin family serine protease
VGAARAARAAAHAAATHAGDAAAADWAPRLRELFGAEVEVRAGGAAGALVLAPPAALRGVVVWLAARPAVHWVDPLPRKAMRNRDASAVTQGGVGAPGAAAGAGAGANLDPAVHPVWAAGITGEGQVVGIGDSGIDVQHCFFADAAVPIAAATETVGGVRQFSSAEHRKIRLYRAFADFLDANGHGTHTSGTLAGIPEGSALGDDGAAEQVGMAPGAKIAFIDLSGASDGDAIVTPYDLAGDYFRHTAAVGAAVHSDSWGSTSTVYDAEAAMIDAYCWAHPSFLPVFPAGNDGASATRAGASGETTVNSPATSKNCLAVGATQAPSQTEVARASFEVWSAAAYEGEGATAPALTFPVVEADFTVGIAALGSAPLPLRAAAPLEACGPLRDALTGTIALVQRGNCTFEEKTKFARAAGAAAVLFFDNEVGPYFSPSASQGAPRAELPALFVPRRIGQNMLATLQAMPVALAFAPATAPTNGFDNLAPFSSQGPVGRDRRVKPDILGVGLVTSAASATAAGRRGASCDVATFSGTSMATPVVAGSAILARQYFMDGFYPTGARVAADGFEPTSALLKATLVAGAAPMGGFESDTGLPIDAPPSYRQGYGRVHLGRSLYLAGSPTAPKRLAVLDAVPIAAGEAHEWCLSAGGGPITVALAWTDLPGSPAAARSLVNDLDLVVRAEGLGGAAELGNGGGVLDSTRADDVNNIEQVSLPAVPPGRLSVRVVASAVQAAAGVQPYALVISGDFSGAVLAPAPGAAGGACAVIAARITAGPEGATAAAEPLFEFTTEAGSAKGVSFECRLAAEGGADAPWQPCSSPARYSSLADGAYTFAVRPAGEAGEALRRFVKDTTPPVVRLSAVPSPVGGAAAPAPPATTPAAAATFEFGADDATAVTFECQLALAGGAAAQAAPVGGAFTPAPMPLGEWRPCASPFTVAWLLPGAWSLAVRGTDAAGNAAETPPAPWAVALDAAAPHARLLAAPLLTVANRDLDFRFAAFSGAAEAGAALECRLEAAGAPAAWAPCAGSLRVPAPGEVAMTFAARVVGDAAAPAADGAPPPTWAYTTFAVDATPPSVAFSSGPRGGAGLAAAAATFEFACSEPGCTTSCVVSAGGAVAPEGPCASPVTLADLAPGPHRLEVRPADAVGNVGAPAVADFVVDAAPPAVADLRASAVAAGAGSPPPVVEFSAADAEGGSGVASVLCRATLLELEPGAQRPAEAEWAPCASPWTPALLDADAHYALEVRAVDGAGLESPAAQVDYWRDSRAPRAAVLGAPAPDRAAPGGTVAFEFGDSTVAEKHPDQPTLGAPVAYWVLLTQVSDALPSGGAGAGAGAGNTLQGTLLDASAGEVRAVTPAPAALVPGSDAGAGAAPADVEVVLGAGDAGEWARCAARCRFEGLAVGSYELSVRGVDAAGNEQVEAPAVVAFSAEGAPPAPPLPTWAIIAIAGGGAAALAALIALCSCVASRRRRAHAPTGSLSSSARPIYGGGYGSSYVAPPYAGGAAGYALAAPYRAAPPDALEAQQVALALAASQRDARERAARAQRSWAAPLPADTDAELRAAIAASLSEPRRPAPPPPSAPADDDADMRAAIEASLREQARGGGGGGAPNGWGRGSLL